MKKKSSPLAGEVAPDSRSEPRDGGGVVLEAAVRA
jgi:hypothetical protein